MIVSTGIANIASVSSSIRRCGFDTELSDNAGRVRDAARVILPGVGSFGAGMCSLRERGLDDAIRDRVIEHRPLLAICLGLQLLCTSSEEAPGVEGLGVIDATVRRLPQDVRVPQFGWNRVEATGMDLLTCGYAYYANSYCVTKRPRGWSVGMTDYGARFVAALERGPVLACQFHPELSGPWGAALIKRWLVREEAGAPC
ncbi:MAG: imidazole glycerol phosphate synthase subunit HisH [Phycisphaerales bacterium JB043]